LVIGNKKSTNLWGSEISKNYLRNDKHAQPYTPKHRLVGDVEFAGAAARAAFITPVPGGVGPMTVRKQCSVSRSLSHTLSLSLSFSVSLLSLCVPFPPDNEAAFITPVPLWTQCTEQSVSESQLPYKTVNLIF
jgi:hypothetical protein